MKRLKGFTLIEIMIVVAIIAILASIAIPGLLRTRVSANESNAISTLRSIATAAENFRTSQTTPNYPASVGALVTATPPYLTGFDPNVCVANACQRAGYTFSIGNNTNNTFTAIANPITRPNTGNRSFCIDETGVMYTQTTDYNTTSDCATQGGNPLQG